MVRPGVTILHALADGEQASLPSDERAPAIVCSGTLWNLLGNLLVLKIYSAPTLPDAHLLLGLLAQVGIEARVFNENAQSIMGEIPVDHAWPEVWIMDAEKAKLALSVVALMGQSVIPNGSTSCWHCHEEIPANFLTCWNCGRDC